MKRNIISKFNAITSGYLVLGLLAIGAGGHFAYAAALTNMYDSLSRLSTSAYSDHAIQFRTPTGVSSGQTIVVTLPSDFDGTTDPDGTLDFSDVDLFEDTTPDGVCDGTAKTLVASGATASQWNAVFSGTASRILTLTSGGASATITAASEVCIKIGENAVGGTANSQYKNATTNGSKTITLAAGSGADTGSVTVKILSNDQVAVTATVPQSLTLSLSSNTVDFGTLSASAATYADASGGDPSEVEAHNLIVGTNAANGYTMTLNGSTLTFGSFTIATSSTNAASSVGTEQFGMRMTATGGTGTVSAPYAASGFAFDSNNFPQQVASATGASANTTYSVRYIANIAPETEAGSYSTTLTYVASANF